MEIQKNVVSWVEIPAADLDRAREFYEAIMELQMETMTLQNGLKMALFPVEEGGVGCALCEHKEFYHPGREGPLVYLSADPDLQPILELVEETGGTVIVPKTRISEEHGFMAVFEDSESNRIALQSRN